MNLNHTTPIGQPASTSVAVRAVEGHLVPLMSIQTARRCPLAASPALGQKLVNAKVIARRMWALTKTFALSGLVCSLVAACGGGGGDGVVAEETAISGKAMVGPIAGGTVNAYELNADGRNGRLLGVASTDNGGVFRVVLSNLPSGGVRLVVSGGSYASLANVAVSAAAAQLSAVVPAVGSTGAKDIAITPLTTFVDRRLTALMASATPLAAALPPAEASVRLAYGIPGSTPIYTLLPDFTLASGEAAMLALLFGSLDQLAIIQDRTPADILRAIGEDWADGTLDGKTTGGSAISFGNAVAAPVSLATTGFLNAMSTYLAPTNTTTIAAHNGLTFDSATVAAVQGGVAAQLQATWAEGGNNSALLSGSAIGSGGSDVAALRKPIAVSISGANSSLAFGAAYAMRSTTSSDAAYVVLPATNVGTAALCFVKLSNLTYRNASGAALLSNRLTYVQGSVRTMTASLIGTDTCLAPGESGLFSDIDTNLSYSAVARMEFTVDATVGGSVASVASVIPQAYSVQSKQFFQSLAISLKNVGAGPARLDGVGDRWFLFDNSMLPLFWGFATDGIARQTSLPAGASASTANNTLIYAGTGTKLLLFVDFTDDTGAVATSTDECSASGDNLAACRQQARVLRLSSHDAIARSAQAAASASGAAR